jgi:hypothetical protein
MGAGSHASYDRLERQLVDTSTNFFFNRNIDPIICKNPTQINISGIP